MQHLLPTEVASSWGLQLIGVLDYTDKPLEKSGAQLNI